MTQRRILGTSILFSSLLAACGGGSTADPFPVVVPSGGGTTTPTTTATGPTIEGMVVAGPVSDATVTVYEVNADGSTGTEKLGTTTTTSSGGFSVTLFRAPGSGKGLRMTASGGKYKSEADSKGADKTLGTLESLIVDPPVSGKVSVNVTPLTTFASSFASSSAAGGKTLAEAKAAAEAAIKKWLGVDGGSALIGLLPSFGASGSDPARIYGLVLGALEQLAKNLGKTPAEIYAALACDFSDGLLDGKNASGAACLIGSGTALDTLGTVELIRAINTYLTSTTTVHKDNGVDPAPLVDTVRTSIVSVSPVSSGASVGSTGAISFARLTGTGKEVVLVAARTQGLVMVDMSDPANPVVNTLDALNLLVKPLMTSVGGVIPIPGASSSQAMLYSYTSKKLITVDLDSQTIIKQADLDITKTVNFSGASGAYIAGGIPDAGRGVIWLATADGYKSINPSTLAVVNTLLLGQSLPENMGGDPSRDMLFGPNYGTSNGGAVDWVDLSGTQTSYSMSGADWLSYSKSSIGIADSGSVDSVYNVGLIIGEDINKVLSVNLDKSKYSFDSTAKTFKALDSSSSVVTNISAATLAGSSIDSASHYALLMAGYSNDVVVAKLDNPAAPKTGTWTGLEGFKAYSFSYTEYAYAQDPHAVGAFNIQGRSYGFLLNGISGGTKQKVMVIDMDTFYKAAAGSNGALLSTPVGSSVKPVEWTTR